MILDISNHSYFFAATPDPPRNLELITRTWESAELAWSPGFDGGYTQTFIIEMFSSRENTTHHDVTAGQTRYNITSKTSFSFVENFYAKQLLK